MVFLILIGASIFSLVFRGFGGEELLKGFFGDLPGGMFFRGIYCHVDYLFTRIHSRFY